MKIRRLGESPLTCPGGRPSGSCDDTGEKRVKDPEELVLAWPSVSHKSRHPKTEALTALTACTHNAGGGPLGTIASSIVRTDTRDYFYRLFGKEESQKRREGWVTGLALKPISISHVTATVCRPLLSLLLSFFFYPQIWYSRRRLEMACLISVFDHRPCTSIAIVRVIVASFPNSPPASGVFFFDPRRGRRWCRPRPAMGPIGSLVACRGGGIWHHHLSVFSLSLSIPHRTP